MIPLNAGSVCPIGHFCTSGTSVPYSCQPGYYMNTTQASKCNTCPEGFFCVNQIKPELCSPGNLFFHTIS